MIYVKFENNLPVAAVTNGHASWLNAEEHENYQSRWDWKSFEEVEQIAANLSKATGSSWLGVDRGESVFPRFDVIAAPTVGSPVSEGFNGDYRPCGTIVQITKKLQVTTSTGAKFRRVKNTATWCRVNGGGSMVDGHIDRYNPHF